MTYKNFGRALTLLAGFGFAACGGSTNINFVPGNSGGEGGESTGGNDGDGGSDGDGGGNLGGDGSGGASTGGGSGGGVIVLGYCGDGDIDAATEDCDDGNERSRDGCSAACAVEAQFTCSGEPSQCSPTTLGNGVIDPGEQCDDGNIESGDGCSSSADIEGTCDEPEILEFVDNGAGTASAVLTADTSAGGASSPAQACNGFLRGAANDRVYFFETDRMHDLTVSVEADFDAVLRIYGSYGGSTCEPDMEAFCVDDAGAGEGETFHYRRMPPGAQIVVSVDGAEEGEEGEFTLTVTQGCDLDHLKLHRLTPFNAGYSKTAELSLKNLSDYCAIDFDRVGLTLTDDYQLADIDLPHQSLPPGEVFRGSYEVDPLVNPNAFDFADEPWNYFDQRAAGAYLCDGPCDRTAGSNVIDGVLTGEFGNIQIPGTTFSPSQVVGATNSPQEAYVRVAYNGVAPNFEAADWSIAFLVDPDDYLTLSYATQVEIGNTELGPLVTVTDPIEGTILRAPGLTGGLEYSVFSMDLNLSDVLQNPTYISYKVQIVAGAAGTSDGCYLGFGMDSASTPGTSSWWLDATGLHRSYHYEYDATMYFTGNVTAQSAPQGTWHVVELTDIDWSNHAFNVTYDGVLIGSSTFVRSTDTVAEVATIMPWSATSGGCLYSDIIVRNGPPGRIWESPPVLVTVD